MARILRISDIALSHIEQIQSYYAEVNALAGQKILTGIERALIRISEAPHSFPICHFARKSRFYIVDKYRQYSLIYRFDDEFVYVQAVWDSRQDPQKLAALLLGTERNK